MTAYVHRTRASPQCFPGPRHIFGKSSHRMGIVFNCRKDESGKTLDAGSLRDQGLKAAGDIRATTERVQAAKSQEG
jgi:hypothetical protein